MTVPTYSLTMKCSNCDHTETVIIPKGSRANEWAVCSKCGCRTLAKVLGFTLENRHRGHSSDNSFATVKK